MTDRMVFEAIISNNKDILEDSALTDWARHKLELLDRKNAKAREKQKKKSAEVDELSLAVYEAVSFDFEPVGDITARIQGEDVTVSKVQYRLTQLVKEGKVEKTDIKVNGRTIKGYRRN